MGGSIDVSLLFWVLLYWMNRLLLYLLQICDNIHMDSKVKLVMVIKVYKIGRVLKVSADETLT